MSRLSQYKGKLGSTLVFCVIFLPNLVFGAGISTVSIQGGFDDSDGNAWLTPTQNYQVGIILEPIEFTSPSSPGEIRMVPFSIESIGGNDVKISYASLAGTDFLRQPGILRFDGNDADGNALQIDEVIDYTMASVAFPGWILNTVDFPNNVVTFRTQQDSPINLANGAPNSSFFTISYVPIPAAVWLFGSGLLGLIGFARKKTA